jgi:hypothetical protein
MISRSRYKNGEAGYTLLDLLVIWFGVALGAIVSGYYFPNYFRGFWGKAVGSVLSLAFGIGFWCFIFVWLIPFIERRRKSPISPDDDN